MSTEPTGTQPPGQGTTPPPSGPAPTPSTTPPSPATPPSASSAATPGSGTVGGGSPAPDLEALRAQIATLTRERDDLTTKLGRATAGTRTAEERLLDLEGKFQAAEQRAAKAESETRRAANLNLLVADVPLEQKELARALALGIATENGLDLSAADASAAVTRGKELFSKTWSGMPKASASTGATTLPLLPGASNGQPVNGGQVGVIGRSGKRIA